MQELSIIYEATGQLQYARGLLTRALIIRPDDPEIIRRHGEIVERLSKELESEIDGLIGRGHYDQAIPKLAVLLTIQPENTDLYYKKAECHLQLGNPSIALVEIERAQSITLDDRYDSLKTTANAAKHAQEVARLKSRALRGLEADTPAETSEAMNAIARILQIDPDNTWAKEQFTLHSDIRDGIKNWGFMRRLGTLWLAIRQNVIESGGGMLAVAEVFNDHLDILLILAITLLFLASPLTHWVIQGFSPRHGLSGRLEHFRLQEVLALVNTHHRTGVLLLRTPRARGKIFFDKGEVYHCKSGRTTGRTAVQNLLRDTEKGYFIFKDGVVSKDDTVDTPLSLILLGLPERVDNVTSESLIKKQKRQSKMKSLLNQQD